LVKGLPASPHLPARHHPWPGQPDHERSHSGRYGAVPRTDGLTAEMAQTIEEKNKAFVLEAFETLFNKKDYVAAERFWSPNYIQHSAHIPPGREGLFALVKGIPDSLHYENGLTVANGDYVLLHGRFSGMGLPANWIVVDIVRLENGQLAEHWDVVEDEATKEASVSGLPMFGKTFPSG
jgi:predicted SnoaL-like aldol condensation-catalyzing enzyme